jgi:hypothetical protein
LSALLALGACSAMPDWESFHAPTADALFRRTSVTSYSDKGLGPVLPEDLVDASGRCAGAYVPPPAPADGEQAPAATASAQGADVPMIPSAVALEMSECDVVKRAGTAEKVDIGAGNGSDRVVTLTYLNGPRPGIYHFSGGRLKSMERAPEPVVAAKPARPAKHTAKSKTAQPKPAPRQAVTVN